MALPPAKRQKRLVVVSSDDEDDIVLPPKHHLPTTPTDQALHSLKVKTRSHGENTASRAQTVMNNGKACVVLKEASAQTSRDPLPPEPTHNIKAPKQESKSKSLYTFFNRTTQAQSSSRKPECSPEVADNEVKVEDRIEDVSEEENASKPRNGQDILKRPLDRRKTHSVPVQSYETSSQWANHPSASQKFRKPQRSTKEAYTPIKRLDTRPWAEKYGPSSLEELAVHKRKILDVRKWLEDVLQGRERKV